jgi:hypothetical protein
MECNVDKKLPRVLDYDENECQCLECHQKRKYARGKRIHGHIPPVDIKRSFFWYQINCKIDGKSTIQFYAKCPYTDRFAKSTPRPDLAMRSPPYVIRPGKKECDQGKECHDLECEMCTNQASETSENLENIYDILKHDL